MQIARTVQETKEILDKVRKGKKSIGFVPTMGALHEGHLELIRKAKQETDFVVASIFVNPIQFNNPDDLEKYPRTLENDKALLIENNCDLLFNPGVAEMYPKPVTTKYDFGEMETVMEGKFRPGHFNGVAVVVKRLFDIVEPDEAFFGEKDYQQLAIIKKLVELEDLPVNIIPCPTVREADGLAMSSRNRRLTTEERKVAPVLYQILLKARNLAFELPANDIKTRVRNMIENYPELELEYFEISDGLTLRPVNRWIEGEKYVMCLAAFLGNVRLIDNVIINS